MLALDLSYDTLFQFLDFSLELLFGCSAFIPQIIALKGVGDEVSDGLSFKSEDKEINGSCSSVATSTGSSLPIGFTTVGAPSSIFPVSSVKLSSKISFSNNP